MVSRLSIVAPNDKMRAHFGPMPFFALIFEGFKRDRGNSRRRSGILEYSLTLKVLIGIEATRDGEAANLQLDAKMRQKGTPY
jgi:hypothetical protein